MKKGLFAEIKEYAGVQKFSFNQGDNPFIGAQQERLLLQGQGEKARLIDNGICAGLSLNWLEFQNDHPKKSYPIERLDSKAIDHIIEMQVSLRKTNTPLGQILISFGPSLQKDKEDKNDDDIKNLLLNPGVKIISFQAGDKSHVAVASVVQQGEKIIFKLFDAARGEVNFIIPEDFKPTGGKNPYTWLEAYIRAYQKFFNNEVSLIINEFTGQWAKPEVRLALHETIKQQNNSITPKIAGKAYSFWCQKIDKIAELKSGSTLKF